MRHLVLTAACVFFAGSAFASSIEHAEPLIGDSVSVATVSCAACPPLKPPKKKSIYVVPQMDNGTERVELKELNGEMKVVRTEAWLGGSPVVFISKASDDVIKAAEAKAQTQQIAIGAIDEKTADTLARTTVNDAIDRSAKTSSLGLDEQAANPPVTADLAGSREFDLGEFELRLN